MELQRGMGTVRLGGYALAGLLMGVFAACGDDAEPTAAERFCGTVAVQPTCEEAQACHDALVADCETFAGLFNDGYLTAANECLDDGGTVFGCLSSSVGSIEPTERHRAFASAFCDTCGLGVSGCEDVLFASDGSDTALVGTLIVPLSDGLVQKIEDECVTGPTCLATFTTCAQGVLAQELAEGTETIGCFIDSLISGGPSCPETGGTDSAAGTGGPDGTGADSMQTSETNDSETSADPSTTGDSVGGTTTDAGPTTDGGTTGEPPCPEGTEGCPCAPGEVCDDGLSCEQGSCLVAGGCPDGSDPHEPNDAETEPHDLGVIGDNDGDGGTLDATLDGGGDDDWYWYTGEDTLFGFVNPSVEFIADVDLQVCMFVECLAGLDETSASCPDTVTASTSAQGRPGCCAPQDFEMEIGCPGLDDSADIYIHVSAPEAQACVPYSLSYHY